MVNSTSSPDSKPHGLTILPLLKYIQVTLLFVINVCYLSLHRDCYHLKTTQPTPPVEQ